VHARIRNPIVHLELHTGDLAGASDFFRELCGWRTEPIHVRSATYLALELARGVGGGIVECPTEQAIWLPYVQVHDLAAATARASGCGASVLVRPREGAAGWRSVIATPAGGELGLWQSK
jgi:uncharacterized protein